MNYEQTKSYLLDKPEAIEDYPFGPDALVAKIEGKVFALMFHRSGTSSINLKCDPHEAVALRDIFESVIPGYHMNKRHWNTVVLEGDVPSGELQRMIDNSYDLVVKTLSKARQTGLKIRNG